MGRRGADTREHEWQVEQAVRHLKNQKRQLEYWARWVVALDRSGNSQRAKEIVDREVLATLRARVCPKQEDDQWYWSLGAALGCTSIEDITQRGVGWEEDNEEEVRWGAFWYTVTGEDPGEHYDSRIRGMKRLSYAECNKILEYGKATSNDTMLSRMMVGMSEGVVGREREITGNEAEQVAEKMKAIARCRLPSQSGVAHGGYQLLVEAEAGRVRGDGKRTWETLLV